MRVAILQLAATPVAADDRVAALARALGDAAADGAGLLVAPELATAGYGAGPDLARLAEPADGPTLRRLGEIVARTGVGLVTGFPEQAGGTVWNSAALLLPGRPAAVYRKCQLYGAYEKDAFAVAPPATVTAEIDGLRVGLLICFDVEFPEHVRRLARAGCDLVAVPTALPDLPDSVFIARRVIPVRAFENQIFVAYAGWAGRDARFSYAGCSCLVAPDGSDLLRAGSSGGFLGVADVEPAAYAASREANPYLDELRTV